MKKFNEMTKGSEMYVVDLYRSNIIKVPVTEVLNDKDTLNISYMMNGHIFTIYVNGKMQEWVSSEAYAYCTTMETAERIKSVTKNLDFTV